MNSPKQNTTPVLLSQSLLYLEYIGQKKSETIQKFEKLPVEQICRIIGWKPSLQHSKLIQQAIAKDTLVATLIENGLSGFVGEVAYPNHPPEQGKIKTEFVYAKTLPLMVSKIIGKSIQWLTHHGIGEQLNGIA